ncbi:MAG: FtsX-like permease family protein [Sphingobacteriales bacterium]|nr:FtsX-like permease family protein [Sphingobacteriales bacterium]MBI3717178.1 FtsX-like permease family protein [Sphingobacteriales bacterium]
MASQRIKEIGIRKVLGASVGNIIYLLSKEFSLLIIIAFAIAVPVAYFQSLADQYKAEQTTQKVFTIFSMLAIFIACIGLLGLAAYATHLRTREISIRKVLGASTGKITTMLSVDFLKLVTLASVIAFPVAWFIMNKWLQDFAYRVNIAWWIFVLAGVLAVLIALFTISSKAIKAALSNPVKILRTE